MEIGAVPVYPAWMKPFLRRFAVLVLSLALVSLFTSGCQTTQGFGEDVENLGDNIQDAAK